VRRGHEYGLVAPDVSFDFGRMMERKDEVVLQMRSGVEAACKRKGVKVITGEGRVEGETVVVGDQTFPFLQYNSEGKASYGDRTRKDWRDYHADWLYDEAKKKLIDPPKGKSFEIQCASCHYSGYTLTPTVEGGFVAGAANDPNGEADIDGDGMPNELNIGCEVCHGPGSAHSKAPRRSRRSARSRMCSGLWPGRGRARASAQAARKSCSSGVSSSVTPLAARNSGCHCVAAM